MPQNSWRLFIMLTSFVVCKAQNEQSKLAFAGESNTLGKCSRRLGSYNLKEPQQVYFGRQRLSIRTCYPPRNPFHSLVFPAQALVFPAQALVFPAQAGIHMVLPREGCHRPRSCRFPLSRERRDPFNLIRKMKRPWLSTSLPPPFHGRACAKSRELTCRFTEIPAEERYPSRP